MKLWQKSYTVDQQIETFTIGQDRELDRYLAPYDILGSLAHIRMLDTIGLLHTEERKQLAGTLRQLYRKAVAGELEIEQGIEDIHSQVELLLTRELGDAGKKIHAGRSRNDQVLVDLRLYFRAELQEIVELTERLFTTLIQLAERHRHVLLPGYTHFQAAMPSSFGLWFSAYAESLVDDLRLLQSVYHNINQNPLGSAAGYGTSFPLDRTLTTRLLGFDDLNYNVVHAQMGRGKTELFLSYALAALAHTLGKLASDVVLYVSQNFAFLSFPDELTTGSSIMPHKKNPDVFELIRARCNHLQSLPVQVSQLTTSLPSGYHRDFQLLKESIVPAIQHLKDCMGILTYALPQAEVNPHILEDERYQFLFSVEVVNELVLQGVPFREAYQQVGRQIGEGQFEAPQELRHSHEGSLGNLCLEEIERKMEKVVAGFPFKHVEEAIQALLE
ncbi:MAG: argininosuccinate lyase [Phaeodactylibacter sp.]|nr:argininosuccinate lyase [Phaeodactylibacter sp.]MCB9048113.1 argininosuccinate lyase [Lewinellaceae bacterium]